MPDTVNSDFEEGQVAIHAGVLQTTSQAANEAAKILEDAHLDVQREILRDNLTKRARVRLQALELRIGNILRKSYSAQQKAVDGRLKDIANIAALGSQRNLRGVLGVDIAFPTPDAATIQGLLADISVQGRPLQSWWDTQPIRLQSDYAQVLRNGIFQGKTREEIVRTLEGGGGVAPVLQKPRHEIRTLVNTSTNSVGNLAMMAFYEANDDVIRILKHLSVFDENTSDICLGRSNKTWKITRGQPVPQGHNLPFLIPPLHGNCRSVITAGTASWEELSGKKLARDERTFEEAFAQNLADQGKTKDQIAKAKANMRASMDGVIPAETTMDEFIQNRQGRVRRMIGPERAELYLNRKIELADLVDSNLASRTTAELRQLVDARDEVAEQIALIERAEAAREEARAIEAQLVTPVRSTVKELKNAPASREEFQNWAVKKGQGGTRENIRWEMSRADEAAGAVMVELDPEELRLAHGFVRLSQSKLNRLLEADPTKKLTLEMPRVDLDDAGKLFIEKGQHRVLYAKDRELKKILVATSESGAMMREILQRRKRLRARKRVTIPAHPLGTQDVISYLAHSRIRARSAYRSLNGKIQAKQKKGLELNSQEKAHLERYHGMPVMGQDISSQYRDIYVSDLTRGRLPDQIAQELFDEGLISAPTTDALWGGIKDAAQVRKVNSVRLQKRAAGEWDNIEDEIVHANVQFRKRTVANAGREAKGDIYLTSQTLDEGDVIRVDGEIFRVTHVDSEGLVMHDGRKYPEVTIKAGERFRAQAWISQQDELGYLSQTDVDHEAFLTLLPELEANKNIMEGTIKKLASLDVGIATARVKLMLQETKRELVTVKRQIKEIRKLAPPTPEGYTINTTMVDQYNGLLIRAQELEQDEVAKQMQTIADSASTEELRGLAYLHGLNQKGSRESLTRRLASIPQAIQRGEVTGLVADA